MFIGLIAVCAFGQEYTVSGTVTDEKEQPLLGTNVIIKGTNSGTQTDESGYYSLTLPEGDYILVFSYQGPKAEREISLRQNQTLDVTISETAESLEAVLVKAVRVDADSPITHSNVSKEELAERNLGQDIPVLLNYLPSVVTTSDAGAGVGYTGIRVRGSDATRVNVTINGSGSILYGGFPDIAKTISGNGKISRRRRIKHRQRGEDHG